MSKAKSRVSHLKATNKITDVENSSEKAKKNLHDYTDNEKNKPKVKKDLMQRTGKSKKHKNVSYRAINKNAVADVATDRNAIKLKNGKLEYRKNNNKQSENEKSSLFSRFVDYIDIKNKKYHVRLHKIIAKFGKTQFEIKSESGVKALAAISKICRVTDVEALPNGVRFFVDSKHCDKIIALLDNLCYDYKIIKIGGTVPSALRIIARAGIAAGICLSVVAVAIYTSFVTRVDVRYTGATAVDAALKSEVDDILTECGAIRGAKISNVNEKDLQNAIASLDGVAFVSVKRYGTHLNIVVKRELPKESFADISGSCVKARKTAVVTRVIVEGGTVVKKYGDVVKAGDTLIDGYVEYGDNKIPVQARGYAYGKVYYKKNVFFPDVESVKEYGAVKTLTRYGIFGKTPKTPDSPFECCEMQIDVNRFGFLVPLKIYTYTFRELIVSERANSLDEQAMKRKAFSSLATTFEESAKILNVYYDIKRVDGGTSVDVTVEAEELI